MTCGSSGQGSILLCYWTNLDQPDKVVIVDILHSRSDLPCHLAALNALRNEGI